MEIAMNLLKSMPAALVAGVLLVPVAADAAGPFSALAGAWSGTGRITMADGNTEQLRCRASYDVGGTGNDLRLTIRCASQGYNFDLGGNVAYQGGRISGTWNEASRNAGGSVSGTANANLIQATATGESFSANLSLNTRGDKQTVSIRSEGTDIAGVSLALNRN
jgi:hypothetical protein